jgi:hypothetical protein
MIHSNNQVIIEYNDFVQIANEKDQYMDGWWNVSRFRIISICKTGLTSDDLQERNVQSTDFVPTKDTMVYSNYDTISAYRNELHQHSRASSGASDGSTIDGYYGSNTFDGRRTGDLLNQYEISQESPVEWNIEQVVTWMESVGLEAVIDKFIGKKKKMF